MRREREPIDAARKLPERLARPAARHEGAHAVVGRVAAPVLMIPIVVAIAAAHGDRIALDRFRERTAVLERRLGEGRELGIEGATSRIAETVPSRPTTTSSTTSAARRAET